MLELLLRVVVSLAAVLGLFWLVARYGQRRLGGGTRSVVRVVGRQQLSRGSSLAVVEVGERVLVVGVSDNGVRLLTEMEPDELPVVEDAPAAVDPAAVDPAAPVAAAMPAAVARPTALAGSMLSSQTWKQAWAAATRRQTVGTVPAPAPGEVPRD